MERDRRRRHKRRKVSPKYKISRKLKQSLAISGVVLAIIAIVSLVVLLFGNLFGKKSVLKETELAFDGEIFATSNSIYYMQGTTLCCSDLKGNVLWSSNNNSDRLEISGSDSFICAYNENVAIVTGPNQEARFTVTPTDYKIEKVVCGKDVIVLLTEAENGEKYLRAFDVNGNDIQRTEIADGELLGFGINGEADNLWTLMLDPNGVEPVSRITISNPAQNKMTGIIEVSDQLIYDVYFGKNNAYLMGTNNMLRYDEYNEKKSETLIYGLKCIDIVEMEAESVFACIQTDLREGDDIYNVHVIDSKGDSNPSDTIIQLPSGVKNVMLLGDRLVCFTENSMYKYRFSGEFESVTELETSVTDVRKLNENLLLVSTVDGVYLYAI